MTPKRIAIGIVAAITFLMVAYVARTQALPQLYQQLMAKAQFLTLTWSPNTDRIDGYIVYWAPLYSEDFSWTNLPAGQTSVLLPVDVSQGTWFFMTAFKRIGNSTNILESKPSEMGVWDGVARPEGLQVTGVMTWFTSDTNSPPIQPGGPGVQSTLDLLVPVNPP